MRAIRTPIFFVHGTTTGSAITAGTRYMSCIQAASLVNATEANLRAYIRTNGRFMAHSFYVTVASTTNSTIRMRKNGANANMVITCLANTTGLFQDLGSVDITTAGERWNYSIVAGTGGITFTWCSKIFLADSREESIYGNSGSLVDGAGAVSNYMAFCGPVGSTSTENNTKVRVNIAGTMKNMQVYVFANTKTGTTTYRSRKNGADGNLVVSFAASTTGHVEDTSNTDTIASGDDYNISYTTTSTGSITTNLRGATFATASTDYANMIVSFASTTSIPTQSFNTTSYRTLGGTLTVSTSAAETDSRAYVPCATTLSKLSVLVTSNGIAATTSYRTRVNSADGNILVSITALTTGRFQDLSNSDALKIGDYACFSCVTGGGAGTIGIVNSSILATAATVFENAIYKPAYAIRRAATY